MNLAVESVAKQYMNGHAVISEGMMNAVEVAIRAYDPCLSCATHAVGKMPLEVTLMNPRNQVLDTRRSV
jgi:NAD-reducing hydrogenase large subunit